MTQSELEALLGRSLTQREANNLDLYLDIAKDNLETLLCFDVCDETSNPRTFEVRDGYRTLYTGIFTEIVSVTIDGETVSNYHAAQWDNRNADWFNSIVFDDPLTDKEVTVDAVWGFDEMPKDLKHLLAQLFATTSQKFTARDVKSKKNEDFSITFGDKSDDELFAERNQKTIAKYSLCGIGEVQSGRVRCL